MKMQIVGKGNEIAYYFAFKQCQIIAQGAEILLSTHLSSFSQKYHFANSHPLYANPFPFTLNVQFPPFNFNCDGPSKSHSFMC